MALIVRRPGASTQIVDHGRPGSQRHGIPLGGPADRSSWLLGNALVGNIYPDQETAALEIALQGPVLESTGRHCMVVYGAPFQIQHHQTGKLQSSNIRQGHTFMVETGDVIHIGGVSSKAGMRAYLCVMGGILNPKIIESRSSILPIKLGATLDCPDNERMVRMRWIEVEPWKERISGNRIRMMAGTHLSRKLQDMLQEARFTIRAESNRMGLRLDSSLNWPTESKEMVSAPATPGTLQLPPGGQPILLGIDAQTIGGYPRLGHVISSDMDRVGQLKPGEHIRFSVVTLEEAERLEQSHQHWLRAWVERIRWSV